MRLRSNRDLIEVNQQVNVTVGPVVTARRGAEKANPAGVMASRDRPHLLAPRLACSACPGPMMTG
jgi:hypothetical protein